MKKPVRKISSHTAAPGGETHRTSRSRDATNPTQLEDLVLREKMTHFDHERIAERIVHSRDPGAHERFDATQGARTKVFAGFSSVAAGLGSVDTPRDVRSVAVTFSTEQGTEALLNMAPAINWLRDAFRHPKAIGYSALAAPLCEKAAIDPDANMDVVASDRGRGRGPGASGAKGFGAFVSAAKKARIGDREKLVPPAR